MIIQVVLLLAIIGLLLYFLKNRNSSRMMAGTKLLFMGFVFGAIVAILRPNWLNNLAHLVGVGRGADLLLYALVLLNVFTVISSYLKFKDYEQRLVELSRTIALKESMIPSSPHHQAQAENNQGHAD